ncbi:ABC transporter ATP-binding protein [Candidatus Dependentiae bacterium]|nr:ABC transporter ATP-binding protein [Candidatus Dependentiae bacterium]
MSGIRLENVTKSFNGEPIVERLNLSIRSGEFFALLGPSGSGKTTLLRLIAGFEVVDSGRIFLEDHEITHTPIYLRRINTVFQHYALFPHLNVFDNVAYSLSIARVPKSEIKQRVIKALQTVHLEKHVYKSIHQLSGGQQQRVALARAIINKPDVLLLDEPLAALDMSLREKMLVELVDLQSSLKTTFVYITHDQFEALTVADRMAIMNADGEIEQIGTPKEIYEFPLTSFVATFVGTSNILHGRALFDNANVRVAVYGLGEFETIMPKAGADWLHHGHDVLMSIRPEKVEISKQPLQEFSNHCVGTVISIIYNGRSTVYHVRLANGFVMHVFEQNKEHFPQEVIDYDDQVHLYWQKENVILLER